MGEWVNWRHCACPSGWTLRLVAAQITIHEFTNSPIRQFTISPPTVWRVAAAAPCAPATSTCPRRSPAPRRQPGLVVERAGDLVSPRRAAAQEVQALVHREAIQPRAERGLAAEGLQLAVRRQEHFLEQVFRVARGAPHPAGG